MRESNRLERAAGSTGPMWKLTIEDDQANKTVVHLVREDYGLGRSEDNAVRLTERNISRRHARLEREADRWLIKDLSSYNGCYVNGQRVSGAQDLAHGDLIQVGDYRLTVEDEALENAREAAATVPAVPRGAGASNDRLVVLVGPQPGAEFPLTQKRMVIGRGEDCDISINHPSVSRVHAELHPLGDGRYEVFDRDSANGVRVNGVELPRSFVEPRDVVELGDVIMKFIPSGEMYIAAENEGLQIAAIGAARRQEAEEGHSRGMFGSLGAKIGAGVGIAALAGAGLFAALRSSPAPVAELVSPNAETSDRAGQVLKEAKQLLAQGDVRGAYQKTSELPVGSSARSTADFKSIQAAYADKLFAQAEKAEDLTEKRALYDEIARSPSIDAARRNRAAEQISLLSAKAVDVNELPTREEARAAAPPPSAAAEEAAAAVVDVPPPAEPETLPEPAAAKPLPPKPASAAPVKTGGSKPTGSRSDAFVRDNPY